MTPKQDCSVHGSFAIDGGASCTAKQLEDKTIIEFGKLSKEGVFVLVGVVAIILIALLLLIEKFHISPWWGAIPITGMGLGFAIQVHSMNRYRHVFLEVKTKRCVLHDGERSVLDEEITGVVVRNSRKYPNGQAAFEGMSELFIETSKDGTRLLHPLVREGQYAALNGLGECIGKASGVETRVSNA